MQFLAVWSANQGRNLVYIHPEVLEVFERYIQHMLSELEAGGVLLGYVRGSHVEIVEATVPSVFDRRFRTFFERMQDLHEYIARKRWTDSSGFIRYIGEWHTHPQDLPSPSGTDLTEWRKLAAKRKNRRPVLGLIVGRKNLYSECMPSYGSGMSYHAVEN